MSLYADVGALFISPSKQDINTITEAMQIFVDASGLFTNISKTEIFPIRRDLANLSFLQNSGMVISSFPCKYLGLPLHFKKPTKELMEPIVQKIAARLPRWK
jgi:hypothetical protein